jgi:hypothetical protein
MEGAGSMSRSLPGIRGVPMRKIVKRTRVEFTRMYTETLACGHIKMAQTYEKYVNYRRCYLCKYERERA